MDESLTSFAEMTGPLFGMQQLISSPKCERSSAEEGKSTKWGFQMNGDPNPSFRTYKNISSLEHNH